MHQLQNYLQDFFLPRLDGRFSTWQSCTAFLLAIKRLEQNLLQEVKASPCLQGIGTLHSLNQWYLYHQRWCDDQWYSWDPQTPTAWQQDKQFTTKSSSKKLGTADSCPAFTSYQNVFLPALSLLLMFVMLCMSPNPKVTGDDIIAVISVSTFDRWVMQSGTVGDKH